MIQMRGAQLEQSGIRALAAGGGAYAQIYAHLH
jgi:hypothetical protein